MIQSYNLLTDDQRDNIDEFLKRADSHRLNELHREFKVARGRNNSVFRENVIRDLMIEVIPFDYFMRWLSQVHLEGNNSLFVYESEEEDFLCEEKLMETLYDKALKIVVPLYDVNSRNLEEIKLIDVSKDVHNNQLIFTVAAPSQLQIKKIDGKQTELRDYVYLAYFIIDFDMKQVVLYMHPTQGLVSIFGEPKKRELDDVSWILLNFFSDNILSFNLKEPEWIIDALAKISEEYFHHNNPIIEKKKEDFSEKIIGDLVQTIKEFDPHIDNEGSVLRLIRGLENLYENEMVVIHKRVDKDLSFNIFLQQADRGATQFKANTRGKALGHAEAGDFIRLMWENGDIFNVGLIHIENEREYPYIVKKLEKYFSLKKYTTSTTEKEVIDNVLRKLNNYKQDVEIPYSFSDAEENGYGTNDSKA